MSLQYPINILEQMVNRNFEVTRDDLVAIHALGGEVIRESHVEYQVNELACKFIKGKSVVIISP